MKQKTLIRGSTTQTNFVYVFVFSSRLSFFCVVVLLLSFLLQPLDVIFASNENTAIAETVVTDSLSVNTEVENSPTDNQTLGSPSPTETVVIDEVSTTTEDTDTIENDAIVTTDTTVEITSSSTPPTSTIDTSETEVDSTLEPPIIGETNNESGENYSLTSTQPDIEGEEEVIDTASSTSAGETVNAVVYSDSVVQFNKDNCVAVSGGSFYCTENNIDNKSRPDGVYSFPDQDGDLEIYIQKNGELNQVTHNLFDDSAPYFDSISNSLVWHRLIDDRYQIVALDADTGIEEILTADTVNNMNPTRSGDYTVWQHWDNNWEIVLYDGAEKKQLTHSIEHDVSPSIRNGLVVWYKLTEANKKTIQLYNIKTGELTTIDDNDGGTISNPRMVVVYETTYKNGDVVTKGYDLMTGKIVSLATTPVNLPDNIPEPDPTGETRALVQPKTPVAEDSDVDLNATTTGTVPPPSVGEFDLVISSSTGNEVTDVDINNSTNTPSISSTTSTDFILDLSTPTPTVSDPVIPDLVILPFGSSTENTGTNTTSLE